jgi:NADPH-dependent glutamate synthase beta subunit-like oxidoreductase
MAKHTKTRRFNIDHKRSIMNDPVTFLMQSLAYEGFTHDTIREATGKSPSYRLSVLGVSTAKVRRAEDEEGQKRLNKVLDKFDQHNGKLRMVAPKAKPRAKKRKPQRPRRTVKDAA